MSGTNTFDLEQLRVLVAVIDSGGFSAAARKTGGLQSTISMKVRRLEAEIGQPLLIRKGKGVEPTVIGEKVASVAREMLAINDKTWGDLSTSQMIGLVRLGIPDDYASQMLDTIRAFRLKFPQVSLRIQSDFSVELLRQVQQGDLDLAVVTRMPNVPGGEVLKREPLTWVAAPGFSVADREPIPLSVYPKDICAFRTSMISALDTAGVPWKIAYTSMSLTGQSAMVGAGLAVTAVTESMLNSISNTVSLLRLSGLPPLPQIEIALHRRPGRPTDPARILGDMISSQGRSTNGL